MVERHFVIAFFCFLLVACGPGGGGSGYSRYATGEMENFTFHTAPVPGAEGTFQDEDGSEVALEDFAGRVVLLNIWATWCAPCIHEMPQLDALAREMAGPELAVIAVAAERGTYEEIDLMLREEIGAPDIPLYFDGDLDFTLNSQISVWPTTILYDREGREIGRISLPAEWNSADARRMLEAVIEGTRDE